MNKSNLILVHFDRQMTESEFFDAMSEVYERNGTKKFFRRRNTFRSGSKYS